MSELITLIGGDSRFLYTASFLRKKGFSVNHIFKGGSDSGKIADTVILPVPAFKNGILNAPHCDKRVTEEQLLGLLPENATVYGGMLSDEFFHSAKEKGINPVDYYKDEQLLKENALLTARAVLVLIGREKIPVGNGKILILGNGRCGKSLCDVLSSAGGHVTVVTSKESRYPFVSFDEIEKALDEASLIINTVPSPVLGEKELKRVNKNATLIEIASAPYGIDFRAAERLKINVIKAPALPGRFFPGEAGEAIAKSILRR